MIFKRLLILISLASLGACSSMTSLLPDSSSETQDAANVSAQQETQAGGQHKEDTEGADANEEKSPEQLIALALNAESDLYDMSKRTLADSTKAQVLSILQQFQQGEHQASLQAINHLLMNELDLSSAVYVLAGDIAAANQQRQQALQHYKNALNVNEYNAKAANRLAMIARADGEFEEAERLYSQAINAQPAAPEAYRNRAVLYDLYLNQKEKALNDYQAYSALLEHQLDRQEGAPLSEAQTIALKKEIKLGKRWLIDVGRQVTALARANNANNTEGK